jgi:hypothetical protein
LSDEVSVQTKLEEVRNPGTTEVISFSVSDANIGTLFNTPKLFTVFSEYLRYLYML